MVTMKIERPVEEILEQFFSNHEKLERMNKQLHEDLSNVDRELSAYYHKLEGVHLSHNTQAHKYMLELQDILSRRRQLKIDTILIRSFIDNTKSSIDLAKKRNVSALTQHKKILTELKNQK